MKVKNQVLLEVVEYTDPYCTWCWGSEPILRRIQETYGDQINVGFKMGGLVQDIREFYDPGNKIGGSDWYKQVAEHWLEASSRHGMPVDEKVWFDIKDEFRSTYPANTAYKSAEFQDEELAKRFLRRMREGAAAERKVIHCEEVQAALAREVGLDVKQFLDDIRNKKAEKALEEDLEECRSQGIHGFPTFLIRTQRGERILLHGYNSFKSFEASFKKLIADDLKSNVELLEKKDIAGFVKKYGKVAPKEVAEVFNLTLEQARERLSHLKEKGLVREQKAGNGFFYSVSL